jgi:subtilisin family serine protease/predicted esterase
MSETSNKVVEVATGFPLPEIGESYAGGEVVWVSRPSRKVVLKMTPGQYVSLAEDPSVKSHRDEAVFGISDWMPKPLDWTGDFTHGDTFSSIGINEDVLKMGNYGANAMAVVGDTGCDFSHVAFQGIDMRGDNGDSHGHGTHVSSTAASTWGIASKAPLYVKRLLDGAGGTGTESGIASGMHTLADQITAWNIPAVLNLSLGGGVSSIIDDATRYVSSKGIWVAAAAGNDGPNATIGSPGRAADFLIGAVDRNFVIAYFSSGGGSWTQISCYMPGVDIVAAAANTGSGTRTSSGTSMATPHMMGVLVLLRSAGMSLADARSYLTSHSSPIGGTSNSKGVFVLKSDFGQVTPPPPPPPDPPHTNGEDRSVDSLVSEARDWAGITVDHAQQANYWDTVNSAQSVYDLLERALVQIEQPDTPPDPDPTPDPDPNPRTIMPGQQQIYSYQGGLLTITAPSNPTPVATFLCFNGGAFQTDDPIPAQVMQYLWSLGFATMEVTYPVRNANAAMNDGLWAYNWAKDNTWRWGADPERVGTLGHSSGGSIAVWIALKTQVWTVVSWSGALMSLKGPKSQAEQVCLQSYGPDPSLYIPENQLAEARDNGIVLHGYEVHGISDVLVSIQETQAFMNTSRAMGMPYTLTVIGGGHADTPSPLCSQSNAILQQIARS